MAGGWACFLVTLVLIGVLTAIIGDLAAHTGCCLGLLPSVTAITFVALGTSLPDTFASKQAATSEPNADNSIGNITGSNSVNVFLGLGMPWAAAAVYWATQGALWRARFTPGSADLPPEAARERLLSLRRMRWRILQRLRAPLQRRQGMPRRACVLPQVRR